MEGVYTEPKELGSVIKEVNDREIKMKAKALEMQKKDKHKRKRKQDVMVLLEGY